MQRLNKIIAVEKGIKNNVARELTEAHHVLQKLPLLSGRARSYQPKDDEGEKLPSEYTKVQVNAADALTNTAAILTKLFDVTATKETANTKAFADVTVPYRNAGNHAPFMVVSMVPVTYLLFLEKQLLDIHTFVKKLPTLPADEDWEFSATYNCNASAPKQSVRTKKVMRAFEKAPATDKHAAQVETFHEDIAVGTWTTTELSGALPLDRVDAMLERVEALQEAVKMAREEANSIEAADVKVGKQIFDYLFA